MSVSGVNNGSQNYASKSTTKAKPKDDLTGSNKTLDKSEKEPAVVYEKSGELPETKKGYERDDITIKRLKAEVERRTQSLRDLVEKMILKQGQTIQDTTDIYTLLREGKIEVDPKVVTQAQKDIAEDGYWGVEQTSERLVSFAKALAGGDPTKADEMIAAVKKGFGEAEKVWGGELPELCKNTFEATVRKLEEWRDSK